jgi:probable metal-binding protein
MQMMIDAGEPYTKDTLRAAIIERFGADTRFYTCSADNMTPDELVAFLEQRGKFVDAGAGFTTDPDKICKH